MFKFLINFPFDKIKKKKNSVELAQKFNQFRQLFV